MAGMDSARCLSKFAVLLCVALAPVLGVAVLSGRSNPAPSLPLVSSKDLVYEGAFRLPQSSSSQTSFEYGGTALAFNPRRQSLFVVGHDWYQRVAEVSIPPVHRADSVSGLATASLLQPFADVTDGRMSMVASGTVKIGGLLVSGDRLYATVYASLRRRRKPEAVALLIWP